MKPRNLAFLQSVLGLDGAAALSKASERSPELEAALLPRTVLAWLRSEEEFGGKLPGVGNFVSFEKGEAGYDGRVQIGDEMHLFEGASIFHVVASVAVAIDSDHGATPSALRDLDIERLGKSIDILARQKMIGRELAKSAETKEDDELTDEQYETKHGKKRLEKSKVGPGPAAGPIAPAAPAAPTATQKAPTTAAMKSPAKPVGLPKAPKVASMSLTRSEANKTCPMCAGAHFRGTDFVGCVCIRELSKSIVATETAEGYDLKVTGLGRDELFTVFESLGKI